MEQTPSWEANSSSASQEIPGILWNAKFYCRVHKSPPLVLTLSQINPAHAFPTNLFKIRSNIIYPSTFRSSKWSLSLRFAPSKKRYMHLSSPSYVFRAPLLLLFWFWLPWWYLVRSINREAHHCAVFSISLLPVLTRPKYLPQQPILEHTQPMFLLQCQRLSFVFMLNTGKIVLLFILIFTILENKLGDFVGKYVTSPKEKYFGLMCIKIAFIKSCKWMLWFTYKRSNGFPFYFIRVNYSLPKWITLPLTSPAVYIAPNILFRLTK